MNPIEHLLIGWTFAQVMPLDRRDRAIVTIASVVPDIDGFGALPEMLPAARRTKCSGGLTITTCFATT